MSSFGADLKREREAKGISLKEISDRTKIGVRLLKALEEEQLEQLPGGIFDKSFLRQYARFLGLDEEHLIGEYLKVTGASADPAAVAAGGSSEQKSGSLRLSGGGYSSGSSSSLSGGGSSGSSARSLLGDPVIGSSIEDFGQKSGNGRLYAILVCLAAVIGAVAYGAHWYISGHADERAAHSETVSTAKEPTAPSAVPAPPSEAQPGSDAATAPTAGASPSDITQANAGIDGNPTAASTGPGTQVTAAGNPTASALPVAAPAGNAAAKTVLSDTNKVPPAKPALAPSSAVPQASRLEPPAGQSGTAIVLEVDARKECWVSIAADGQKQWQGTMHAATMRRVEARGAITLTLGDAGAVALTLNGKPLTFSGRSGEVKTLSISANGVAQPAAP